MTSNIIFNIKFTVAVVLFAIVAGLVACTMGSAEAAARPGYLAPSFNTSIVKHADVDANPRMDIAFGSDDAAYRAAAEPVARTSTFGTFLKVVSGIIPSMLPTTAGQCSGPVGSADYDASAPLCQ